MGAPATAVDVHDADLVAELTELIGTLALAEFQSAQDHEHAALLDFYRRLPQLSDAEYLDVAESAIYASSLANGFRGNWNGDHSKATACYHEAARRLVATGHDRYCAASLYARAHRNAMSGAGHTPGPRGECHCNID